MASRPVFRFAPSPNGELHLGHALSALLGFARAQAAGGDFLLRIEDIDVGRTRPEFVAGIFEDLRWLGLTWAEPVLLQSQRLPAYRAAAQRLETMGLLYPCFASRAEIAAASSPASCDPDGVPLYPGLFRQAPAADIARRKADGEPFALRLDMARAVAAAKTKLGGAALTFTDLGEDGLVHTIAARPERWGDAIIARKEIATSYHLAVVIDDAWQGVTHVTRGRDLFAATDLQRLLQLLLDLPVPVYQHHRLITDAGGRKLAKSAGDTSLRQLRRQGLTATDVRRLVGLSE
ncbi:MAG: tRNA glutamyl-Q(34) synthetase GluQRS [Hyphomicrobiaceae bacterium]